MTFDPIAADLAVRAARRSAGSARPDAPVVPEPQSPTARLAGPRLRSAAVLHALARWMEPTPANTCQPG